MFLFDWIWNLFAYLGFKKNAKLLIIGLDNAGKSTLLDIISSGRLVASPPTNQARCKSLDLGRLHFTAYDLGGHPQARRVWRDYYPAVDGILFVIDAADDVRFPEAKAELDSLLMNTDDIDENVPIAVLMNKTDKPVAVGEEHLANQLAIHSVRTGKEHRPRDQINQRPLEIFPSSLLKRTGYGDALRWLAYYIE